MGSADEPTAITIDVTEALAIAPRCVRKCVTKCVNALHTSTTARPRQHWVSASPPSPTTRPPRRTALGMGAGSRARTACVSGASGGGACQLRMTSQMP